MTDKQQEQPEEPREGQPERSGGGPSRGAPQDPEVLSRPTRRRFSAEYKSGGWTRIAAGRVPGGSCQSWVVVMELFSPSVLTGSYQNERSFVLLWE